MNERIIELALQAGLQLGTVLENYTIPVKTITIEQRKFAELIVRECVTVMYDSAIKRKVPPDLNQTPTYYALAVLEHFGVEL